MIPVYITHDGQAFTAKYSHRKGTIHGEREYSPHSLGESLKTYAQPVVGAVYSTLSLNNSESCYIYDEELSTWSIDHFGISFKSLTTDVEALVSLVKVATAVPEQCQIIYRLERRIKFILLINGEIKSVIHMAEEELATAGIEKLIQRSNAWYRENALPTESQLIFVGDFSETPAEAVHLFPNNDTCSVVAAGIPLNNSTTDLTKSPAGYTVMRNLRGGLLTASLALLAGALLFYTHDRVMIGKIGMGIENSPYQLELTSDQIAERDSLAELSVKHISTFRHLSNQRRWSNILENFSEVSHEGVQLGRFGSRESEGVLNLAFDGEGASEKAVTGYVQKLKESSSFGAVQLMEIDRKSDGKYRFRIQCNVQ